MAGSGGAVFLVSATAPEKRVGVAMVALAGPALPWYQLLIKRSPNLGWEQFIQELMKRFGNNGAVDEYEAFAVVRHTGTLAEFVAAFEARLALVPDLAYHQYLGFFLAGLRPEIRMQMKAAKITNYTDAVHFVLDVDQVAGNPPPTPQSPVGPLPVTSQAPSSGRSLEETPFIRLLLFDNGALS